MSDQEPEPVAPRRRKRRAVPMGYPVEARISVIGQKGSLDIRAVWVQREPGRYVFGVPEPERPYMTKRIEVSVGAGLVVEIAELAPQFAAPQQPAPTVGSQWPAAQSAGGPGAVLRLEQGFGPPPGAPAPLRATVRPGVPPASEVTDEAGNRVVVPAAFGMAVV